MLRRLVASIERFLGSEAAGSLGAAPAGDGSEFAFVASRELGGPHVVGALWAELGLAKTLARLARRGRVHADVERAILVMVCQRCLEPGSKLAATRWLRDAVHVDGISDVTDDQLYRAMDFLLEHQEAVQEAVFSSVAHLLNLEVDVVFFDTTSTYFEVDEPDGADEPDTLEPSDAPDDADTGAADRSAATKPAGGFRRYGHSKDHRPDLPQVVIGLAVTREGIPVRSWVWPGNTADQSVIDEVKRVARHERVDPEQQLDRQRRLITNEKLRSDAIHNDPFAVTHPVPSHLQNIFPNRVIHLQHPNPNSSPTP